MIHRCRRHDSWEPKGGRRAALTAPLSIAPALLLVGYDERFRERCERVLLDEPTQIVQASVVNAATTAARWRPMAILLAEDLYNFDPDGFDALARDVQAALARTADEGIDDVELDRVVRAAVLQGKRHRSEST